MLESSKESDDRNEETEAARLAFDELAAMAKIIKSSIPISIVECFRRDSEKVGLSSVELR